MFHSQKVLKTIQSLASEPEPDVPAELRRRLIAEAAYFRAEKRGFQPGFESQDWEEAEAEVDARLHAETAYSLYTR
ncbi:DUF2934 domain-containing protein [Methyloterricola oryzae]|uniref:DUF2934 domain-containing protein n=1 Tax=Methyloterricola oryzae TaxID=1495050 RepID=UPI0005EB2285|nr:DUF2934 domain-containing protein [Methyloterricola oryzae]